MKFGIYIYSLLQVDKMNTLNLGMKTPGGRKKESTISYTGKSHSYWILHLLNENNLIVIEVCVKNSATKLCGYSD